MAGRGHGHGTPLTDPWGLDPELQEHIQRCPCQCNHLGYGNFLDYQIPPCPRELPVRETTFNIIPHSYQNGRTYHRRQGYRDFDYQLSPLESCSCSTDSLSSRNSLRGPWCICLVVCIIIATLSAGLGLPLALNPPMDPQTPEERLEVVQRMLKEIPLVDGHNDLPWNLRKFVHNRLLGLNLSTILKHEPWSKSKWSHTDLPRLKAGLLGAQFWSAYVPCKSQHLDAVQLTLEQIDVIKRLVDLNSEHFTLVASSHDIVDIHRKGRIASIIGVEGGHSLGNSLAVLRTFYNLGARLLTITHSCDTPWARGAKSRDVVGLTAFGRSVIREMNRLGMIVDLSHTSVNTAKAALNASHAPVIFSHSAAYTLCNSTRNVPDDVLKLVALNGGVVMVNFYTLLVTCNYSASLQDVIKHINHIRAVAGVDHVGIGAGYDGINMTPSGLEDVSTYPNLFAELLADPDWTIDDLKLLAGLNLLRVFAKVEAVRDHWKLAEVLPGEDVPLPYVRHSCSSLFS